MNPLLEEVLRTRTLRKPSGELVRVHSETPREQCEFLQALIAKFALKRSLEIGVAYGVSTVAIVEAISKNGGRHLAIDKFQYSDWGGEGLEFVKQAGHGHDVDFIQDYSFEALPRLLSEGRKFDFAYIDTTKLFDWLMVDFFFVDKLMEINGIIVFDDVKFPGIRRLLRYLAQLPHYRVYGAHPENSRPRALRSAVSRLGWLPGAKKVIHNSFLKSDYDLGVNAQCVALIKTGLDERHYDWHVEF